MTIRNQLQRIGDLELQEVTDWYIPEDCDTQILVYPGAIRANGELAVHANNLRSTIEWKQSQSTDEVKDWRIEYRDITYRAHKQKTIDGFMYMLRKIPGSIREVAELGMPQEVSDILIDSDFGSMGGLVLISGGAGHGKSTTLSSITYTRVKEYGHFLLTVEDPPEFSLHGDVEARNGRIGKIIQVPAEAATFANDLKDALRCYPGSMHGSMLMVGEVRDGDTAAQLLRSAVNGHLVFATIHASEPIAAIERISALANAVMGPQEVTSILAMSLRAVIQQRITTKGLNVDVLFSMHSTTTVASKIKTGNFAHLSTEIQQQKNHITQGTLRKHLNLQ
jgi:twitching motility protein PilT